MVIYRKVCKTSTKIRLLFFRLSFTPTMASLDSTTLTVSSTDSTEEEAPAGSPIGPPIGSPTETDSATTETSAGAAQCALAIMHRDGEGGPVSMEQARVWFARAAEQGYPDAQYDLAGMHGSGLGGPISMEQARVWYERAAEQGDAGVDVNAYGSCRCRHVAQRQRHVPFPVRVEVRMNPVRARAEK